MPGFEYKTGAGKSIIHYFCDCVAIFVYIPLLNEITKQMCQMVWTLNRRSMVNWGTFKVDGHLGGVYLWPAIWSPKSRWTVLICIKYRRARNSLSNELEHYTSIIRFSRALEQSQTCPPNVTTSRIRSQFYSCIQKEAFLVYAHLPALLARRNSWKVARNGDAYVALRKFLDLQIFSQSLYL